MPDGILLVRHGESTWNAEGRWQGQGDPPLSPRGEEQARALAACLREEKPSSIVASDLRRAADTARILGAELGLVPRFDARLREHDVGAWSGLPHEEIAARWPEQLARFRAGDLDVRPGGGESRREMIARARAALAALRTEHPGRLLLVSHRGWIRAVAAEARLENCEVWRLE